MDKAKVTIRLTNEALNKIDACLALSNSKSRNELIEKALNHYLGYISSGINNEYLCEVITSTLEGIISNTENRLARLQFKQAVETSKMAKLLMLGYDFDEEQMKKIHLECLKEVKKLNGIIKLNQDWINE